MKKEKKYKPYLPYYELSPLPKVKKVKAYCTKHGLFHGQKYPSCMPNLTKRKVKKEPVLVRCPKCTASYYQDRKDVLKKRPCACCDEIVKLEIMKPTGRKECPRCKNGCWGINESPCRCECHHNPTRRKGKVAEFFAYEVWADKKKEVMGKAETNPLPYMLLEIIHNQTLIWKKLNKLLDNTKEKNG